MVDVSRDIKLTTYKYISNGKIFGSCGFATIQNSKLYRLLTYCIYTTLDSYIITKNNKFIAHIEITTYY